MNNNIINMKSFEQVVDPHSIARSFNRDLIGAISDKFNVDPDDLSLMLDDLSGVYLSAEKNDTLCCLANGKKNGHIYLVTATIQKNGQELADLKSDIIS
ncbi:MAG: hypothetical protein WCK11_03825 [Candidatus Falkowbacteria bacterium]